MKGKAKRILAVDDEKCIRELLADFLSYHGYDVATASNGEEALAQVDATKPHLVIMDIKMPGLDGLEVLRRIKTDHQQIGVVMLSAFGDSATMQTARQAGADYYLQKPVNLEQLREILRTWNQTSSGEIG